MKRISKKRILFYVFLLLFSVCLLCSCGEHEHNLGEREIVKDPTCTSDGVYKIECEDCGEVVEEGKIASLGHDAVYHGEKSATCKSVGHKAYEECKNCSYTTYLEIPKIEHMSSAKADCISAETCTLCGEVLSEALGHSEKIISGTKATCLKSGISEGKACAVCGTVIVKQITLSKKEHTPIVIKGEGATCTETGRSDAVECAECREIIVRAIEIPKRSHTYSGSSDAQCNDCGFKRRVGADVCIHENQIIQEKVFAACDSYGLTQGVICDDCGEVLVCQEVIAAKEHTKKLLKGYGATCVLPGLGDGYKCSYCNTVLKAQEIIIPDGHSEIADKPISPTCESGGVTEGRHCAVCQEITLAQNKIEAAGHSFGEWYRTSPISKRRDCNLCDYQETKLEG